MSLTLPPRGVRTPDKARAFFSKMAHLYLARIGRGAVELFGEKTPEHTSRLDILRQVFPDAKIVFFYRDGRDVALSLSQMPWMVADPCVGICIWLYHYGILRRVRESGTPDIGFFRYEYLVSKPREAFGKMLDFLDAPFDHHVIRGFGNSEGIPPRELLWKGRALEPISMERIGCWQRQLSADQVGQLERLGETGLSGLGYPLITDGREPLTWRCLAKLGLGLARFAAKVPPCHLIREISRLAASTVRKGQASFL